MYDILFIAGWFVVPLVILQEICRIIYRLYFHPLARIPGPKLAAVTQWYEFYYDILKWPGGQYWHQVDKMHERYGPVIRITPSEVHVKDPDWYDQLYCAPAQGIRDKYAPAAHVAGTPLGIFGTVEHDIHRKRRAAISTFFSKRAVSEIEPWIHDKTEALCATMQRQQDRDGGVDCRVNFLAMTTDMIATHAFYGSEPPKTLDLLQDESNAKDWKQTIAAIAVLTPIAKQIPWLLPAALKLSVGIWMAIAPPLGRIVKLNKDMRRSAQFAINEKRSPTADLEFSSEKSQVSPSAGPKCHNIFHTILHSSLPAQEKTEERLAQEGVVAIAAGAETCGRVLTNAVYYILAHKDRVMPPLMKELTEVMPTPNVRPDLKVLEQLPYLTAVIRETLRISAPIVSRLPLVSPDQPVQYHDHVIPPGNPISMSLRDILYNPDIYRDPLEFLPERWLNTSDPAELERMNKFYVPFSRGTRMCIGINIAYAQLYIVLATLLRRFSGFRDTTTTKTTPTSDLSTPTLTTSSGHSEFHLHPSTSWARDVKIVRDCFIGEPSLSAGGMKVVLGHSSS